MKMVGAMVAVSRVAKNLTQKQLGELVGLEEQTIASIEQGRRMLMPDIAEQMDQHLALPGILSVAANRMPDVDSLPDWAEPLIQLERMALALSSYQNQTVPGLLQTEPYAEAVFRSRVPFFCEEEIEEKTATRMVRQTALRRKKPMVASFVIWEPVLRMPLGGPEVLRGQLQHLLDCSSLPGVMIQVLPLDRTSHPALDGPFILLEPHPLQHVAYIESQRGSQLVSDLNEVSIVAQRYAMLRTEALNPEETRALLKQLLGDP
ncbi:Scr1 family TA system antitoxin-like transcriptional regulator [Streptomyces sp. NPDC090741]|uniref:helix-turn-helix domain-containing protein n=1 Tax=Streptomyces sp. NPDC090741 TaxID=3365967 RepID=UPI00382244D9